MGFAFWRKIAACATFMLALCAGPLHGAGFIITDLGTLNGSPTSLARRSTLRGSWPAIPRIAATTTSPRSSRTVPSRAWTLGGTNSYGYGINDAGDVVGASATDPNNVGSQHAFLWDHSTQLMTSMGTLGGWRI